ncbi:MAG: dipeptidase [Candidatus Kapabacteria bacterium]|nr:dipeptidase [Candidatus Kapabacteria bacterium]
MSHLLDYISANAQRFESELMELLAIPSISTEPENAPDVRRCAEWLSSHLTAIGLQNVKVFPTKGHPIVYADWLDAGADKPTILFYGHYDVQPVDPLNLWTNPPFEPTVRDGKVFARGATDDKGQVFLHVKCLEAWLATHGSLPVNVKLLIEGEEEIGSANLEGFLEEHKQMLACDSVVISDTSMYRKGQPSIVYGLRGLCYMEVHVQGPNRDLHSGSFGGAVQNPLNALAHIIAKLKDENGRIQIPGFYDDVIELTAEDHTQFAALDFDEGDYKRAVDVDDLGGEPDYTPLERLGARPTLDVNGFIGGFTGTGAKTVLPAKASAKISMRLVANQNTDDIAAKFTDYVQKVAPKGVRVTVENHHGANPVLVPRDGFAVQAAVRALERAFGKTPVFTREGGSIPITLLFSTILNAPTVLMGFGLNSENAHSPDEHFDLENFHLGIKASALFYEELG